MTTLLYFHPSPLFSLPSSPLSLTHSPRILSPPPPLLPLHYPPTPLSTMILQALCTGIFRININSYLLSIIRTIVFILKKGCIVKTNERVFVSFHQESPSSYFTSIRRILLYWAPWNQTYFVYDAPLVSWNNCTLMLYKTKKFFQISETFHVYF